MNHKATCTADRCRDWNSNGGLSVPGTQQPTRVISATRAPEHAEASSRPPRFSREKRVLPGVARRSSLPDSGAIKSTAAVTAGWLSASAETGTNAGTNRDSEPGSNLEITPDPNSVVGVTGFEPATPTSRTPSAARACRQLR